MGVGAGGGQSQPFLKLTPSFLICQLSACGRHVFLIATQFKGKPQRRHDRSDGGGDVGNPGGVGSIWGWMVKTNPRKSWGWNKKARAVFTAERASIQPGHNGFLTRSTRVLREGAITNRWRVGWTLLQEKEHHKQFENFSIGAIHIDPHSLSFTNHF